MPNIELLEKSTPVAPVRIAALAGCQDLANEVDKKLPRSSVLVPVRAKVTSKNLFVVPTFLLW